MAKHFTRYIKVKAKSTFIVDVQHIVCFTNLGKIDLPTVDNFKLEPIFATATAAPKNGARYKSGQNIHLFL